MWRGMLVSMSAALLAAPAAAAAADTTGVTFEDVCGDNTGFVETPWASQTLPATERSPRFDLAGAAVTTTPLTVTVRFDMCAPVGAPDGLGGTRVLVAGLDDGCSLSIAAEEVPGPEASHSAAIRKTCHDDPYGTGQCPLYTCTDVRFDSPLPRDALVVDGSTLTLTVERSGLSGEAAEAFAPGAEWVGPNAASAEAPTSLGAFYGDDIRTSGPTGIDFADGPAAYTLD